MMVWTDETDALLMQLWEEGIKTKDIGKRLGTSKGSVIGRHRRLLERQARIVHPAFDPKAGVWFLSKPKVGSGPTYDLLKKLPKEIEAGSIQELLKKLPKGFSIKDYRKIA